LIISSSRRSGAKAVTWRVIATATTMFLVYVFTGELDLSLGVGVFDVLLKLAFYFLHERAWNRVDFGRDVTSDNELSIALDGLVNIETTSRGQRLPSK